MRHFILPLLALSSLAFSGCKAVDAMDNTEAIKTSVQDVSDQTKELSKKTGEMGDTTQELSSSAKKAAGLQMISNEAFTKQFSPPSAGLLAGAKLVAENMTAEELVAWFFASLEDLRNATPRTEERDPNFLGGYSRAYAAEFNREQRVKLVTLQAIAGQIPQSMVEEILRQQISDTGKQPDVVYQMLTLRATFLNEYFLAKQDFEYPIDTMGKLEQAVGHAGDLDFLTKLPFAEKLSLPLGTGVLLPDVLPPQWRGNDPRCEARPVPDGCSESLADPVDLSEAVSPDMAKPWWRKILKKIDKELPAEYKAPDSAFAGRVEEIRQLAERNR